MKLHGSLYAVQIAGLYYNAKFIIYFEHKRL